MRCITTTAALPTGCACSTRASSRCSVVTAAKRSKGNNSVQAPRAASTEEEDDEEARLEAYESLVKSGKKPTRKEYEGMQAARQAESEAADAKVVWKASELFPEGWEKMTTLEKAGQLYMGERGFLFWSAKIATGSVVALGATWIIFRFVLPGLGVYEINWLAQ